MRCFSLIPSLFFPLLLILLGMTVPLDSGSKFEAKLKSRNQADGSNSALVVTGGTGMAVFKDIQVPVNIEEGSRGDGSVAADEFQDHSGFPLYLSIGYFSQSQLWRPMVSMDFTKVTASAGPPATQSASYSRINLLGGIDRRFALTDMSGFLGVRTHARRSSFNNVSSGHHINAGLVGVAAGIEQTRRFKVESFFSMAPISTFNYHTDGFGGKKFQSATSEMMEFGLLSSFNMHQNAWFDIGAEQERALVKIGDVQEYDSFGLAVTPTNAPERVYDISTTILKIGFRKNF
jgi:hypothetical protein